PEAAAPAPEPLAGALAEGAIATGLETVAELAADDLEILHDFHEESTEALAEVEEKILALEADPEDMETIHALFRTFHSMKGSAGFLDLEVLGKLAHETENLLDRARNGELVMDEEAIGLLLTSIDLARGLNDNIALFLEKGKVPEAEELNHLPVGDHVAAIRRFLAGERKPEPEAPKVVEPPKPIGEILVEEGAARPEDVGEAVAEQLSGNDKPLGSILVDKGKVAPAKVGEALKQQQAARSRPAAQKTISAIRVDTERLDALMNSVGEIVIAQSHALKLATEMEGEQAERLQTALYEVERLSRNLQDEVMGVRMMPIGPTFKQFARFVRDSSRELGKEVELVITGEETELDKTVIEKIGDPLKHLIRNSLDHGLETPEERQAAGKPRKGRLELRAAHEGGSVIVEVIDDGRGISREKVLAKAKAKGLVSDEQALTDEQILRLIFHPGFSTAEQVSSLSGRGVGMDVVKKNVEELRGSVDVESVEGEGSVLRIRLPLTLAIIEGMVVSVSGQPYIVPVLSIVESIRPRREDVQHVSGQGEVLFFRNEYLPL
ncbi:MAG: chemotaxis protein CheA, partial [Nitrospirae bacterium]